MNRSFHYVELEKIGEGTYGEVFKANQVENSQLVALKRICLENEDEGVPCTAIREISLLRQLSHPNIVKLLDVFHSDAKLTLVFEFLDCDLQQYMERFGNDIPPSVVWSFAKQLLQGVAFCHANAVLHRDLKPQNLLISSSTDLKVADFGLARAIGVPVRRFTSDVVTLWYRSPDVLLGSQNYGTPVDVWSVGCVIAEMCCGAPLFPGTTETSQLTAITEILGRPSAAEWPSKDLLPKQELLRSVFASEDPFADLKNASKAASVWDRVCLKMGQSGVDLVKSMLQWEPSFRVTAQDALLHPYFQQQPVDHR